MALTRVGAITLSAGENFADCAVIDTTNGFAYFGSNISPTSPGKIVKIRLSDFTKVATLTLNAGENQLQAAVIDTTNGFAYFGTTTSPGKIVKIRLSDFTEVATLTLNVGENNVDCAIIDVSNGFAYFGMDIGNGKVVKVRLSDFTEVATINTSPSAVPVVAALIDTVNGFAYFGTNEIPGRISKVRLSDFTKITDLLFASIGGVDHGVTGSAVIDTKNGFAYFADDSFPTANLHIVKLSNFTENPAIAFNANENFNLLGLVSVIAPVSADGFAYFATYTTPTIVAKFNLSGVIETQDLSLNAGENSSSSAVIDTVNGFAYIGTDTAPGIIVKVSDSNMVVPVAAAVTNKTGRSLFRGRGASEKTGEVCGLGRGRR